MNALRFLRKCVTDPPAAVKSAKLVLREVYGTVFWKMYPNRALRYRVDSGGVLLLEPGHSFTHCFWPDVQGYEPEVRYGLKRLLKRGQTFIDCGANVGYFSILASGLVGPEGKVLSIEANPETFSLLERNLKANGSGTALHCALTSRNTDSVELFVDTDDVFSSMRKGGLVSEKARAIKVRARSLDEVVLSQGVKPDFIKIDVEGADLDVLRSGREALIKHRPLGVIEYGTNTWPVFGVTSADLVEFAESVGYLSCHFNWRDDRFLVASGAVWESRYTNIFLIPKERARNYVSA